MDFNDVPSGCGDQIFRCRKSLEEAVLMIIIREEDGWVRRHKSLYCRRRRQLSSGSSEWNCSAKLRIKS